MRTCIAVALVLTCVIAVEIAAAQQQHAVPSPWAYGFDTPPPPEAPAAAVPAPAASSGGARRGGQAPDTTQHQVTGSAQSFSSTQARDSYGPGDWFPGDHPEMPEIVAHGSRERQILACSLCHYPDGKGRPENAGLSGLPADYFAHTMLDFKNDNRKSADARKANTTRMIGFAKGMTDDEIKSAAAYFAAIKWAPRLRVVEADTVPKTRIVTGLFQALDGADAGKEPIGQRIIEIPQDTEQTETLRNPRSPFIAYVPPGSVKKGEALVTTGGGRTTPCAECHGANFEGMPLVPALAGRSPSYVVRQLHDFQLGTRKGPWAEPMTTVVAGLTAEDMLNVSAYLASRPAK